MAAMRTTNDSGLVFAHYGPMSISTEIDMNKYFISSRLTDRVSITIDVDTEYPFSDEISLSIDASQSFPLYLRIPGWATSTIIVTSFDDEKYTPSPGLFKVACPSGSSTVDIQFNVEIVIERRYNNAAAVYRGPLLYALWLEHNTTVLEQYAYESEDLEFLPLEPWNIALQIEDDSNPENDLTFENSGDLSDPFAENSCPLAIYGKGKYISWPQELNAASPPPTSPVDVDGTAFTVKLIPFGATKLRLGEIPTYVP